MEHKISSQGSNEKHKRNIIVGSRDSQLARKQTQIVIEHLQEHYSDVDFEIKFMKTIGDKILNVALSKIGEKGLFTKELEDGLTNGSLDMIVHSLKDLPTKLPDGLVCGSVLSREDPRDAVVMHPKHSKLLSIESLPPGSNIGTSSLRRIAQLRQKFPYLNFKDIRGNLNTRLRKLDEANDYDAIVLAVAGLIRMGWTKRISQVLDTMVCMYAISQGALAIECHEDNEYVLNLLHKLSHYETTIRCIAERSFLKTLEGGCSAPVAVHSQLICGCYSEDNKEEDSIHLTGGVFSIDGKDCKIHSVVSGNIQNLYSISNGDNKKSIIASIDVSLFGLNKLNKFLIAENVGIALANRIIKEGGDIILKTAKIDSLKKII